MGVLDAAKVKQFVSDIFHCVDEMVVVWKMFLYPVDWCPLGA